MENFVIFIRQNVIDLSLKLIKWQQISGKFCSVYLATFHQFMCVCISPRKNIWEFCCIYSTKCFKFSVMLVNQRKIPENFCYICLTKCCQFLCGYFIWAIKSNWKMLPSLFGKILSLFFVLFVNWQKISENFCYTYSTKGCHFSFHVIVNWQKIAGTFTYLTTVHQFLYLYLTNKKYLKLSVILIQQHVVNFCLDVILEQ